MRNPLLSKKLKRTETRLLIIDDNQIRFNQIHAVLSEHEHHVQAHLLDDLRSFEKQLNLKWDMVIFGRAYDLKYEQALSLIHHSNQPDVPLILLQPDDFTTQQLSGFIRKGVYDVVSLDDHESFYLSLLRALSFSRLNQTQQQLIDELEAAQSQAQFLVEESSHAVALIQEGIHIQANAEYLKLFGLYNEDDVIGLPILDILQPQEINDFKQRFKKVSQGQFDLGGLEIHSQNQELSTKNPLRIEFLPSNQDETIQISIDVGSKNSTPVTPEKSAKILTYQHINRTMTQQPADMNALVLFSLKACPEQIFQLKWNTPSKYLEQSQNLLKEQTNAPIFRLNAAHCIALLQADSQEKLQSKLFALSALAKTQLIQVDGYSFPLHLNIGYSLLNAEIQDEAQFEQLVSQAFSTALPQADLAAKLQFEAPSLQTNTQPTPQLQQKPVLELAAHELQLLPTHELESATTNDLNLDISLSNKATQNSISVAVPELMHEPALIKNARKALENYEIQLKYQQLYDKEDSNLHLYEVTAGFIFENQWKGLNQIREIGQDQELSIKLDRWVIVEACKQLHNFITQYPDTRLIINLNKEILLHDRTFAELVSKLLTITRSKLTHPLILQFSEEEISQYQDAARQQIVNLRQHGAEISLRNFGESIYSDRMLREFDINAVMLHDKLAQKLSSDKGIAELQERINTFLNIRPNTQILLRELNDMTSFANAWNVNVRYLAGDYFQKKLDQLLDVQDQ